MTRQIITVDIAPEVQSDRRLKVSQYDVGRPLGVYIVRNGEPVDCSGYTAQLYVFKPDRTYYEHDCDIAQEATSLVTWETGEQETVYAGACLAEIRIMQDGVNIGTANFVEWIEESPTDLSRTSKSEVQSLMALVGQAEDAAKAAKAAVDEMDGIRIMSLDATALAVSGTIINAVGIPVYVDDVTAYADYGITETGWYVFARIFGHGDTKVTENTTVTGAAGSIVTVGAEYVDIAMRFGVASMSSVVTISWDDETDRLIFNAPDLAVRNLDYRSTFYVYDISDFITWAYILTTDTTFVITKAYYMLVDGEYVKAPESVKYALTADTVFAENKTYYTEADGVYTAATVTVGEEVPADTYYELAAVTEDTYYVHSKLTISGMIRNVTYRLNEMVDCPIEIVLPNVPDDGYGAWFEIQMQFNGSYSITLLPTDTTVKIGTAQTQAQTAGINVIDRQYSDVNGIKMWTLLNTHSNIPTT